MAWDGSWVRMGERRTADKLFLKMICILYRPARPGASTAPETRDAPRGVSTGAIKKPSFLEKRGFWAGAAVVFARVGFLPGCAAGGFRGVSGLLMLPYSPPLHLPTYSITEITQSMIASLGSLP